MAKREIPQDVLDAFCAKVEAEYYGIGMPEAEFIANMGKYKLSVDTSGQKYARIVSTSWSSRSSYGFIVLTDDDPKFKFGDILKAASWKAPAKNFARGNIFDPKSYAHFYWTGL